MSLLDFKRYRYKPTNAPIALMRVEYTIFRVHLRNTAWVLLDDGGTQVDPNTITRSQVEHRLREDLGVIGLHGVEYYSSYSMSVDLAEEVINRLYPDLAP